MLVPKEKISNLIPAHCEETICRVFTRDPAKLRHVQDAFRRYLQRNTHNQHVQAQHDPHQTNGSSTPWNNLLTIPLGYDTSPRKKTNISTPKKTTIESPAFKRKRLGFEENLD